MNAETNFEDLGDQEVLESLFASHGDDLDDALDEIENAVSAIAVEPTIEPAISSANMMLEGDDTDGIAEAMAELEAMSEPEDELETDAGAVEPTIEAATPKERKERKGREKKEPAEPRPPRVTYVSSKPSEVLTARVGNSIGETLLLEDEDVALDPAQLEEKQQALLNLLNARPHTSGDSGSTQKKVAEKIVQLFAWVKNGGKLNEVMRRTFTVLLRDGYIQSGDKGNLHAELLAKPYSVGTCRAQAGQMLQMLPLLKITHSGEEKGKLTLNPSSLIIAQFQARNGGN
jgi:hypothetical protein